MHVWWDQASQRLRQDVYGGLDSTLIAEGVTYNVYPRIDREVCSATNSSVGPTANGGIAAPLPDLSKWTYSGQAHIGSHVTNIWRYDFKVLEKVNNYRFYVTEDGRPVRLHMMGRNMLVGSHFDEYLIDFNKFTGEPVSNSVFETPKVCKGVDPSAVSSSDAAVAAAASAQVSLLMPWTRIPSTKACPHAAAVAAVAAAQGAEALQHAPEVLQRLAARARHQELLSGWDSAKHGFNLAPNKFMEWLPHEYAALMSSSKRGTKQRRRDRTGRPGMLGVLPRRLTREQLPESVDWRGTGADGVVKDQATCGSCWSFAATGTMQGAWFLATGESLSFSEQQLVDCSWEQGNNGCGGGWMEYALEYVGRGVGIASEEDYQYLGMNGYCTANATSPAARFKGFVQITPNDEEALMEALHLHGPISVSIDALPDSFKFYSEGVYYDLACSTDPDELDHAVLLVGYGTAPDGHPFWMIKNSWSKYWGEDGFIRISRRHDCGVTDDPILAVVDEEAAATARLRTGRTSAAASAARPQEVV